MRSLLRGKVLNIFLLSSEDQSETRSEHEVFTQKDYMWQMSLRLRADGQFELPSVKESNTYRTINYSARESIESHLNWRMKEKAEGRNIREERGISFGQSRHFGLPLKLDLFDSDGRLRGSVSIAKVVVNKQGQSIILTDVLDSDGNSRMDRFQKAASRLFRD